MKKFYSKNTIVIIITLIGILFACKKDIQTYRGDENGSGTGNGSVHGVITDLNNSPVSNATVTGGTVTATTDASGKFTLTKVQFTSDTVVVVVTKDGFFDGSKTFVSSSKTVDNAKIQLIPKSVSGTIAASSGGNIAITGGGSVNFGSGFIHAGNGNAYSGNVSVSTFYINPTDQDFSKNVPGDLKAASANNQQGTLQSFGVVAVEMNDDAGNKLQLANGTTATITIPIPSALQSSAPSSVPLWYFDNTKGAWKQEGVATKQGSNYTGVVSHFTFWNAGELAGSSINLTAIFIDSTSGAPFANKLVNISRWPDTTGSKSSYTDNTGKVSGLVPANEVLRMNVHDTCGVVYSKNIGPFSRDTDLGIIKVTRMNCNLSPAVARFTYSVSGSTLPVTVYFSNTSTNATSWMWDFGDGGTSTAQHPSHTYLTAGDYTVRLIASGAFNTDSTFQILHLFNQPAVAGFTYSVSGTSLPVTVNFSNTSSNATSWLWNFGDGDTSSLQNPSHTYSNVGDYTVRLIAKGALNTDSTTQIVHVLVQASDAYINLTLNGINYSWAPPDSIIAMYLAYTDSSGGTSKYTYIDGNKNGNSAYLNIENGNATLPGTYNATVGFYINGKAYSHNGFITTTVTEYGAVGGYIIGSASGQVFEKNNTTTMIPFSLQYKVTRTQ